MGSNLDRRSFVKAVGAVAGGASLAPSLARGAAPSAATPAGVPTPRAPAHDPTVPPYARMLAGDRVRALFGEIGPGTAIDRWTVVAVCDVYNGGIPVVMRTADGETFQVDVLRRDASARDAVATTPTLALFLVNEGSGSVSTNEEHGLGAMALGRALAEREAAGATAPALLTRIERSERYPTGVFRLTT